MGEEFVKRLMKEVEAPENKVKSTLGKTIRSLSQSNEANNNLDQSQLQEAQIEPSPADLDQVVLLAISFKLEMIDEY